MFWAGSQPLLGGGVKDVVVPIRIEGLMGTESLCRRFRRLRCLRCGLEWSVVVDGRRWGLAFG